MAISNLTNVQRDVTTAYFNNFFGPMFNVSQNVDDAVIGFFEQLSNSKQAAKALAGAVIYTAAAQGYDPMEVLQQFYTMPKGVLNSYLAMFLNLNREGTSLLGLSNAPITSQYISRAILP